MKRPRMKPEIAEEYYELMRVAHQALNAALKRVTKAHGMKAFPFTRVQRGITVAGKIIEREMDKVYKKYGSKNREAS